MKLLRQGLVTVPWEQKSSNMSDFMIQNGESKLNSTHVLSLYDSDVSRCYMPSSFTALNAIPPYIYE